MLHSPSHMVFISWAISVKLIPRAASLSRTPSMNLETVPLIFSQVPMIASRNPSLVFQRCTKAATRTAITATMATTGAEIPLMAADSFPAIPVPLDIASFSFPMPLASAT